METGKHWKSAECHSVSLFGLFIRRINRIIYVPAVAFCMGLAIWYHMDSLQMCFIWKMECGPVWYKPVKMRDRHNHVWYDETEFTWQPFFMLWKEIVSYRIPSLHDILQSYRDVLMETSELWILDSLSQMHIKQTSLKLDEGGWRRLANVHYQAYGIPLHNLQMPPYLMWTTLLRSTFF